MTQQNAAGSEEMATSAEELSGQAEELKNLVAFFKIEDDKTKIFSKSISKSKEKVKIAPVKKQKLSEYEPGIGVSNEVNSETNKNTKSDIDFENF